MAMEISALMLALECSKTETTTTQERFHSLVDSSARSNLSPLSYQCGASAEQAAASFPRS
jgi:hypothetical protein